MKAHTKPHEWPRLYQNSWPFNLCSEKHMKGGNKPMASFAGSRMCKIKPCSKMGFRREGACRNWTRQLDSMFLGDSTIVARVLSGTNWGVFCNSAAVLHHLQPENSCNCVWQLSHSLNLASLRRVRIKWLTQTWLCILSVTSILRESLHFQLHHSLLEF